MKNTCHSSCPRSSSLRRLQMKASTILVYLLSLVVWLVSTLAQAQLAVPTPIISMRFEPLVTKTSGDTCRLLVQTDPHVVSLKLSNDFILYDGHWPTTPQSNPLELFDDGTHGDIVAHDHVFTIDKLSFNFANGTPRFPALIDMNDSIAEATVTYDDNSMATVKLNYPLRVFQIRSEAYVKPNVTTLDPQAQESDYCLNLVFPVSPPVDSDITTRYYGFFPDDRDFLIIADEFPVSTNAVSGTSGGVSNRDTGFGKATRDDASSYGSAGRLQQITRVFGAFSAGLLNHELLHRWAAFLSEVGLSDASGHWRAILRPSSGFGSYWGAFKEFTLLGGNTYRATFNPDLFIYSDLEQYLMGLVGPDDVAWPVQYLINDQPLSTGYDPVPGIRYRDVQADGIGSVGLDDIVAAYGKRVPAAADAQKQFNVGMVVIYDRLLTEVELAWFDMFAREYGEPSTSWTGFVGFGAATAGRAELNTLLRPVAPSGTHRVRRHLTHR